MVSELQTPSDIRLWIIQNNCPRGPCLQWLRANIETYRAYTTNNRGKNKVEAVVDARKKA